MRLIFDLYSGSNNRWRQSRISSICKWNEGKTEFLHVRLIIPSSNKFFSFSRARRRMTMAKQRTMSIKTSIHKAGKKVSEEREGEREGLLPIQAVSTLPSFRVKDVNVIDRYSRVIFPLCFVLFKYVSLVSLSSKNNVDCSLFYWGYYTMFAG